MSLPDRFRTLIVDRAKYYTYMLRSDPQHAQLADRDFQRKLRLLKVDYATKNDYMRSDVIAESIATNIGAEQKLMAIREENGKKFKIIWIIN